MQPDSLSAFLHSPAWLDHSGSTFDAHGNAWKTQALPKRIGYYQASYRLNAAADFQLPAALPNAWFYRVQADSTESDTNLRAAAGTLRIIPTANVQPKQTLFIDLSQGMEAVLAGMKQKHRYNIKVATKHGVTIRIESANLEQHLDAFLALLDETAGRHTFRTHTKAHYTSIVKHLEPERMVHLLFAEHEGKPVAAMMLITYKGVATYLHGGSDYAKRNLMAPFLLHKEAMEFALSLACSTYDFWGTHAVRVHGEYTPQENHPSAGTTRFKLGFGGEIREYPQTVDIILNPLCYSLYSAANRIRSRKRAFS